jgi:hypothetical protein
MREDLRQILLILGLGLPLAVVVAGLADTRWPAVRLRRSSE